MATETVTIEEVDGPNANGFYEVTLGDGRKASTKDDDIAQAAFAVRGGEAEVSLGTQTKGKFTNIYLNEVNGVRGAAPKRTASKRSATPDSGSPDRDARIAAQWALGRATELHILGKDASFDELEEAAKEYLARAAKLAAEYAAG